MSEVKITFVEQDRKIPVMAVVGQSLMQAGLNANVGIGRNTASAFGECGGELSCATCHVHLEGEWAKKVELAGDQELELLEFCDGFASASSRLSCQVKVTEALDGLEVKIADSSGF